MCNRRFCTGPTNPQRLQVSNIDFPPKLKEVYLFAWLPSAPGRPKINHFCKFVLRYVQVYLCKAINLANVDPPAFLALAYAYVD